MMMMMMMMMISCMLQNVLLANIETVDEISEVQLKQEIEQIGTSRCVPCAYRLTCC